MPLPTNKTELLKNLNKAFQKLDAEFEGVNFKKSRERGIDGEVSACDIVAYQIGWGKLLLSWEKAEIKGKVPEMPAKGYKWNELGALAKSFYKVYQDDSLATLRKDF